MTCPWKHAPVDATHYGHNGNGFNMYYRIPGKTNTYDFLDRPDKWVSCSGTPVAKVLIPRPLAWNGEGLPPAGTVCEMRRTPFDEWEHTKVLCLGKSRVFIETNSDTEQSRFYKEVEFRPIKTPEQIAVDKREGAIKDLMVVGMFSYNYGAAIYDAGYRKLKEQ